MSAVVGISALLASPASAAPPDATWSGMMPASSDGARWSHAGNWLGTWAPVALFGSLHFPALTNPACTAQTQTGTCYWSTNDMSAVIANGLTVDDGAPYYMTGNQIALGAGGISAAPSSDATSGDSPYLAVPLKLTAPQTWTVAGGPHNQQLALAAPVTGGSNALAIALSNKTSLGLYADAEVGAVTVTGTGDPSTLQIGFPQNPGALNGTNGKPIKVSGAVKLVADPASTGPLTFTGSSLQVGYPFNGGALNVSGAVSLDSSSSVSMFIPRPGTRAGTDFSQLAATGNVNLGGASLDLGGQMMLGEVLSCPALTPGSVATLVKTTGSLTGTFAGVPDGATIPLDCPDSGLPAPTLRIHYTANAVTATVLSAGGTPTATSLSADPAASLTTNRPVTLSATVSADSIPSGTVEFDTAGTPITGCMDQKLIRGTDSATATCQTELAAAGSGETVTAEFRPPDGTDLQGSSDGTDLVVDKGSTATSVSVSDPSPPVGETVTYTAAVVPDQAGIVEPQGAVQFLDGGVPISACSDQPLIGGDSSSAATCTLSYATVGPHMITATYAGDDNFTGSTTSAGQSVTVQPGAVTIASNPPASGSLPTSGNSPAAQPTPGPAPQSAPAAPRCTLQLATKRVLRSVGKKQATMMLSATCDQDARVTVRGTLTTRAVAGTQRGRVFHLAAVRASLTAGQTRLLVIRLPAAALLAIERGAREGATFTLSGTGAGGATRVVVRAPALKL